MHTQSFLTVAAMTLGISISTAAYAQEPTRPIPLPPEGQPAMPTTGLAPADETFLRKAAAGGQAEVELATMAQQKASSEQVRQLAQRIAADHKKANAELMAIATARRLDIDPKPTATQKTTHAKLESLSGAQFDRAYLDLMEQDHQKDIREFERQATQGVDVQLKAFAAKALPNLKAHLKLTLDAKRAVTSTVQ